MSDDPTVERFVQRFDQHSPDFADESLPWEVYSELQRRCPVTRSDAQSGFWVLSKYRDVAEVSKNEAFLHRGGHGQQFPTPWNLPESEFFKFRRLMNPFFSAAAVSRQEALMRRIARETIETFRSNDEADLHEEFAKPFPAQVLCRLLGLPDEDWRTFAEPILHALHEPIVGSDTSGRAIFAMLNRIGAAWASFSTRLLELVDERRSAPRDDFLSLLANGEIDGRPLTVEEITGSANLIIMGGVDTVTAVLGQVLVHLARHPAERQRLIDEPEIMPSAVEEYLRYFTLVHGLPRRAPFDCEFAGQAIAAGEELLPLWAAANRDEEEFPAAGTVVLDRFPNRHLAFSAGIHRCIGSQVARLELRVGLEEFLAAVPDYAIDEAGLALYGHVGNVYSFSRVPARIPVTRQ